MDKQHTIEEYKKYLEHVVTTHSDVVIEINRTSPDCSWTNGYPEELPSWIEETFTIRSRYYYEPKVNRHHDSN